MGAYPALVAVMTGLGDAAEPLSTQLVATLDGMPLLCVDVAGRGRAERCAWDGADVEARLAALTHQELYDLVRCWLALLSTGPTPPAASETTSTVICRAAVAAAGAVTGISPTAILGPARSRATADARAVAMSVARDSGLTLTVIGDHFGRDHTTVLHAVRRTRQDARLCGLVDQITRQNRNSMASVVETPSAETRAARAGCRRIT